MSLEQFNIGINEAREHATPNNIDSMDPINPEPVIEPNDNLAGSVIEHIPNPEQPPLNKTGRRDFMRLGLRAAVASLMTRQLSEGKEVTETIAETPVFKEGIRELHTDAMKRDHEVSKIYIKRQGGKDKWVKGKTFASLSMSASMDINQALELLSSEPVQMIMVHTHPKAGVDDYAKIKKISIPNMEQFRIAPSTEDILAAQMFTEEHGKRKSSTKLEFQAVDANGVWTYKVPEKSKLLDLITEEKDLKAKRTDLVIGAYLTINTEFSERVLLDIIELSKFDPRAVVAYIEEKGTITDEIYRIKPELTQIQTRLKKLKSELISNEDYKWVHEHENGIKPGLYFEDINIQNQTIERFIRHWGNLGVKIGYTPIEHYKK